MHCKTKSVVMLISTIYPIATLFYSYAVTLGYELLNIPHIFSSKPVYGQSLTPLHTAVDGMHVSPENRGHSN